MPPRSREALSLPLPILAHQAPILPLKLWRPAAWNGAALVLGSVAPDVSYFRVTPAGRGLAHSVLGQFVFCLPLTVALVAWLGYFDLGEALVARTPDLIRARAAWLVGAGTDVKRPGGLLRACAGSLVGSFSHIGLDALTHNVLPWRMAPVRLHVRHVLFTTPTLVQLAVSGVFAAVSVWLLVRIARLSTNPPPARRPGLFLVVVLALVGLAVGVALARPALANPDWYFAAGRFYVWGHLAFLITCGSGAGVLVAGLALRAWDARRGSALRAGG